MAEEIWSTIPGFDAYAVSNYGRIFHHKRGRTMSTSPNTTGYMKVGLLDNNGIRRTMSVSHLVAEAFVEPPNRYCDHVIVLDGDLSNVAFWNLAWRPRGFAWSYHNQVHTHQPALYRNLPVRNVSRNIDYGCIIEAGMTEGLLFDDVWRSACTGVRIFPSRSFFRVIERV